jgi:D-alanyl-D-alanine carboxypeptidase/D-alanyl-D-alanine-endopeptidase (penicillin-binding protein 4)
MKKFKFGSVLLLSFLYSSLGGAIDVEAKDSSKLVSASDQAKSSEKTTVKQSAAWHPSVATGIVESWLHRPDLLNSRVSVELMDLPTGKVLFEHNGNKRATPASCAKVLTTACAYEKLGATYTFNTRVTSDGVAAGGILKGNLYIQASQDPTLTREGLGKLIHDAVSGTGAGCINKIDGKVIVLCPNNGREHFQMSWLAEDFGQDWMPVSSSLVVDNNLAYTSGLPKNFKVVEATSAHNALLDNLLASGIASSWISFDRSCETINILRGVAYGANGQPTDKVKRDGPFVVSNPDSYNLALIEQFFSNEAISCEGFSLNYGSTPANAAGYLLSEHHSKPLSLIIKTCLYESDNLYAQQLLRALGSLEAAGQVKGRHGAGCCLEERGLDVLGEWLTGLGVPGREVILFDGCGLSRKNSVTPHALNIVLKHMAHEKLDGPFLTLLKEQGNASGNFRFKTGAMETVRGISGILHNAQGRNFALTILVNGHTPSVKDVRIALFDLVERLKKANLGGNEKKLSAVKITAAKSKT